MRYRVMIAAVAASMIVGVVPISAAPLAVPDRAMDRYFSIWADDSEVTPTRVADVYAHRVSYYGKAMTAGAVYRDKLGYIRQWPHRHYDVVPGSVSKSCDATDTRCRITAILRWRKADAAGRNASEGASTIVLGLVREDGQLKIASESGTPVASAACSGRGMAHRCSGFR